jgi:hypothetical protein
MPVHSGKDNIETDIRKRGCEGVDWNVLAEDGFQQYAPAAFYSPETLLF